MLFLTRSGKKVIRFYNNSGSLENIVQFLENVQKKVNYINLSVSVDGCKIVKIILHGSKDLQYLASDKLRDLADQFLENN